MYQVALSWIYRPHNAQCVQATFCEIRKAVQSDYRKLPQFTIRRRIERSTVHRSLAGTISVVLAGCAGGVLSSSFADFADLGFDCSTAVGAARDGGGDAALDQV
jgi:ferric-dicitrate binding protein FerR (iron transport regulator)